MRTDDIKILDRIERSWLEPDEWFEDQDQDDNGAEDFEEEECDEYE